MTEPTDQQVVEILAKREGIRPIQKHRWHDKDEGRYEECEFCKEVYWCSIGKPYNRPDGPCVNHHNKYLSSLDSLQPILATLTEEEWIQLDEELCKIPIHEQEHTKASYTKHCLSVKPSQLARCIGKVIAGEKGE